MLGTKTRPGRAGEIIEIPVFSLASASLAGWQLALQFDTALLQIKNVRWPTDVSGLSAQDRGWNLARPGELRVLSFNGKGASTLTAGMPLFFIQAQLRRNLHGQSTLFHLAPPRGSIPSEAYNAQLQRYDLSLETSEVPVISIPAPFEAVMEDEYQFSVYPNPADANFRLEIEASAAAVARLEIHDLLGREIANRPLNLVPGLNSYASAQLPVLLPGQYVISLFTSLGVRTLRLVKH